MIKIHKEGRLIFGIITSVLVFFAIILSIYFVDILWVLIPILLLFLFLVIFVARFFRVPERDVTHEEGIFYSPADGKIARGTDR